MCDQVVAQCVSAGCIGCCVGVSYMRPPQIDQCCKSCAGNLKECFSNWCRDSTVTSADGTAVADKAATLDGVPPVSQTPDALPGQMNME
eukprot:1241980-Rhodomonas_salina.2